MLLLIAITLIKIVMLGYLGAITPSYYRQCPIWLAAAMRIAWFSTAILVLINLWPVAGVGSIAISTAALACAIAGFSFTGIAFLRSYYADVRAKSSSMRALR